MRDHELVWTELVAAAQAWGALLQAHRAALAAAVSSEDRRKARAALLRDFAGQAAELLRLALELSEHPDAFVGRQLRAEVLLTGAMGILSPAAGDIARHAKAEREAAQHDGPERPVPGVN